MNSPAFPDGWEHLGPEGQDWKEEMKKIPTLFERNYEGNRQVRNEVSSGCEWVMQGEGVATRKFDGTCCLIRGGKLFRRHEVKPGGIAPDGFEPANEVDSATGKQQGWVPVGGGAGDKYHREAWDRTHAVFDPVDGPAMLILDTPFEDGTYELVGVKVQGNPEHIAEGHWLVPHGTYCLPNAPRDFEGLKAFLATEDIEGIVWHHPDGRMAKLKSRDFGIKRGEGGAVSADIPRL